MDVYKLIESLPIFKGLSKEQHALLAQSARTRTYGSGQLIIGDDDRTRTFYLVAEGQVKLSKTSYDGKEQTLYLFGPRELFGLCAVFSDTVFPANAVALEESTLIIFPGEAIEAIARQDPRILFNIIFVLSRQLKDSMSAIESLTLKGIPQRIAAYFLTAAGRKEIATHDLLTLPVTQRELSKLLGTTPETLSRILKKMAADKLIRVEGKTVEIIDRQALELLAGV